MRSEETPRVEDAAASQAGRSLTRRGLVAGAVAGGLGVAATRAPFSASGEAPAARRRTPRRADVVVVGAGLAGLVAASRIAAKGRSVIVLEARDRVGGRLKNWRCGMPPACDCGFVIAPQHTRVRALAKDLGVNLYRQHAVATGQGNDVICRNGQRTLVPAGGLVNGRALAPIIADAGIPFAELDSMAATIAPDRPWEADHASEWDAMTVETWKEQNTVSDFARFWIEFLVWVSAAADTGDVSLLHFLTYLARLGDGRDGTSEVIDFLLLGDLVEGGIQQLPLGLAQQLGRRVVLGAPVRRIVQGHGRVRVESDAGSVLAKRAIVATAPSLNALIDFEPGLPALRAQLAQRYPQGSVTTFAVIYERPWWRDRGLTGRGAGLEPFFTVLDYSPPDNSSGRLAATCQAGAQRHYTRMTAQQRQQALLDNLGTYFGGNLPKPLMMLERNWDGPLPVDAPYVDPDLDAAWTRGCPGFLPPGVLSSFGPATVDPFRRVHWASTEHALSYNTYVEGAISSAEATVDAVLAEL